MTEDKPGSQAPQHSFDWRHPIRPSSPDTVEAVDTPEPNHFEASDSDAGDPTADDSGLSADKPVGDKPVDEQPGAGPARPVRRSIASRFELPILILVAVGIAVLLKTFVIQPFYIPSPSMEKTLHGCTGCSGDRILVFKPIYHVRDPHPGDIVVFKAPDEWGEGGGVPKATNPLARGVQWFGQLVGVVPPSEKDLVKRVIATGGQTIKCCDDNGNIQISDNGPNGPWRSLNEPYIYEPLAWSKPSTSGASAPGDNRSFAPVTIPKDRLWVMGDHRNDSADSLFQFRSGSGDPVDSTVPISDVIGKSSVIAWPPSRWRTLGTPPTFKSQGVPGLGAITTEPASVGLVSVSAMLVMRARRRRRQQPPIRSRRGRARQ